jgi:hypothetical protein
MKSAGSRVLTINGGSSSIKFALFEVGAALRQILGGELERIGLPEATLRVKGSNPADNFSRPVTAADHTAAVGALMEWIEEHSGRTHWPRWGTAWCMAARNIASRSKSPRKWSRSCTGSVPSIRSICRSRSS